MSFPFRKFSLAGPEGDGKRPYLNADGAFLGDGVPLLEKDEFDLWRPRPQARLEALFAIGYGGPVDLTSRMRGLEAVAAALNRGDRSLASIHLVHMDLPELPDPCLAERMAWADGLAKANYHVDERRDAHNQKWVTQEGAASIVARAKEKGGWLSPNDVHPGNEKQCVSLVRHVFPKLPRSSLWKEKTAITPENSASIPPGTAIATFRHHAYHNTLADHAAIYMGPTNDKTGIKVVEQWDSKTSRMGATHESSYSFHHTDGRKFHADDFSTIGN